MRLFIAAAVVLLIVAAFFLPKVPSEARAIRAVENLGYTQVVLVSRGYSFGPLGGCGQDDLTKFKLRGVAPSGQLREVEVCAPLIGGFTVRA